MSDTFLPGDDTVTIQVGALRFQGWQTVQITRSCESMPNHWAVSASAEFLDGDALAGTRPGQACLIYIGLDLVITGWIDRRSIPIDAHNHQVTLSGRGITRNLVDCSADLVHDPNIFRTKWLIFNCSCRITRGNFVDIFRQLAPR